MSHHHPRAASPDPASTLEPRRHPWLLAAAIVLEAAWIVVLAALVAVR